MVVPPRTRSFFVKPMRGIGLSIIQPRNMSFCLKIIIHASPSDCSFRFYQNGHMRRVGGIKRKRSFRPEHGPNGRAFGGAQRVVECRLIGEAAAQAAAFTEYLDLVGAEGPGGERQVGGVAVG